MNAERLEELVKRARSRAGAMMIGPCSGITSSQAASTEFTKALDAQAAEITRLTALLRERTEQVDAQRRRAETSESLAAQRVGEVERWREALEEIVSPVKFMQRRADEAGGHISGPHAIQLASDPSYLQKIAERALTAAPADGWRDIATAPNDSSFRWYGLHVQHTAGHGWFEAHYVCHDDDGQMRLPSGDNFDDWAFIDFEVWAPAPLPPAPADHRKTEGG